MGSGYAGAYADVIEEDSIKKFCPQEFQDLMDVVEEMEGDMGMVARDIEYQDFDEDSDVYKCYTKLVDAFKEKTGLDLYIGYHSEDDGDRYDEVSEVYWSVDGMYELSEAGKKMKEYVSRKSFVIFG